MKQFILLFVSAFLSLSLTAQNDSTGLRAVNSDVLRESENVLISIYPVPVRENTFTVRSDRDILSIKVTNIIGQDIYRIQYDEPLPVVKIILENPRRGMYLVTLVTADNKRIVKKIMIEGN